MSKDLGLKELFRRGQISAQEALGKLAESGAQDTRTGRWFQRLIECGDTQRDPELSEKKREENLKRNAQKEHNRKWRRGKGRFAFTGSSEKEDEEE